MSIVQNASLHELRDRWFSDKSFQEFQKNLLSKDSSEDWFSHIPKLEHPWEKCEMGDFRGASFKGASLREVDLTSLRFDHADFSRSNLTECSFQGAVLTDASFEAATLTRAHMIPIYGDRVNFNRVTFSRSALQYSKLLHSSFISATMHDVSLSNADLTDSSFVGVRADKCKFNVSVMQSADFSSAQFVDCNFRRTVLQHADMSGTLLQNCDMSGSDFRGANLARAKIQGGLFEVVQQGTVFTPTRFDDTPEARSLVAASGATGIETIEWAPVGSIAQASPKRLAAGQACTRSGFWSTPAKQGSRRYFVAGTPMPDFKSDYGSVFWQWDANQEMPKL